MTQKLQIIPGVVAWYPPAGVSFAFLLAVGPRFIPAVFVASLLSNFLIYDIPAPAPTLIAWAAIYSGVYGIASGILRGWIRVDPRLRSLRDVLWMILTASVVASILAIISVSASAAAGVVPAGKSNAALLEWWIGETIGVLVVAPALLIHGMPWVKRFAAGGPSRSWRRVAISQPTAKTLLQAVSVLAALYLVFGVPALEPFHPLYLLAVPLIWISLDYGLSGISLGILAVNFGCTFLMWSMHFDPARLGELQLLLLVISAVGLLLGVVRTERLQANEALLGSEAKFRTLIEQLPTIVYINPADDPSHSLYVSPQIESVLGYTPKEWLEDPKLWEKRLHPDDRAAVMADVEHIKTTGVPWSVEYRLLAKDGRAVWMHDQVVLVHDADGRPQFWQGVMTDVSARQIAKAAQEQSEKLFRALFEFSPEAILLIDPHSSDGSWRIVD
ncbi:MAG TPA: PAS domain-containing protein, partial [Anaerolineales bacterium]